MSAFARRRTPSTSSGAGTWTANTHESTGTGAGAYDGIFLAVPQQPGDGIRLAVKDLFDTAGLTTTYGSAIFADHVPATTATAVARLEDAGYVDVGKTNLHEFAYGITSQNPHYGTVPNPSAPGRSAGGSSGGSAAALAAGLADAALGTDSGGSIRIPASWCGIVGFKPSYGIVPMDGCFPLARSFDHAGPMARSVTNCRSMLEVLAPGALDDAPTLASLADLRIGVTWTEYADPLVRERVEAVAAQLDAKQIDFPLYPVVARVFMREVADVHRELIAEHADLYGDNVRTKVTRCLAVTDEQYELGLRAHEEFKERAADAMDGFDLLLTPTTAFVAPPADVDELSIREASVRFTIPFNALGWPALALPLGPAEHGLPASLQVVGTGGADALVLDAGALLSAP